MLSVKSVLKSGLFGLVLVCPLSGFSQSTVTPATGDSRTVTEPTFPTVCATVAATKYVAFTNTVNIDPYNPTASPQGQMGATGGTDAQPSSVAPNAAPPNISSNYNPAETKDNTALTNAMGLSSCSGKAVELIAGDSGQNAFVLGSFTIPANVSIIGDAGIRVFASRSPADYGGGNCGTMSTANTTSCTSWINIKGANSGIYGYAIWDGRGWSKFTTGATTQSFYYQRLITYCVAHGGTKNGSPTCPSGLPSYQKAYGPNGLQTNGASNYTEYKFTLRDGAQFQHNIELTTGCTFWGVKLFAPFELSNTDGWDPLNTQNCTFTHGIISNGDNITALKSTSTSTPTKNISFVDNQTGAGIGVAFGTDVEGGISNYLVSNLQMNGNLYNSAQADGLSATDGSHSGTISQITYQNICMQNEQQSWNFNMAQSNLTGLLLQNIAVLPSTAPYTTGKSGTFELQGRSGKVLGAQINNAQILGTNQGGTNQYASIYLGPGTVSFTPSGTGVTVANHVTTSPAAYCTSSGWKQLNGELNIKTASLNNQQSVTTSGAFTLQAVLQPTTDINIKEQAQPLGTIQFLYNGSPTGSPVALSGDNTYASLTISEAPQGTSTYSAKYVPKSGEAYQTYTFGSVTVTNGSGPPPPPPPSTTTLTAGGTINVGGNLTAQ